MLLEFSKMSRSEKVIVLIGKRNWEALLMLEGPIDVDWFKMRKGMDRTVVDHLQRVSPIDGTEFATWLMISLNASGNGHRTLSILAKHGQ